MATVKFEGKIPKYPLTHKDIRYGGFYITDDEQPVFVSYDKGCFRLNYLHEDKVTYGEPEGYRYRHLGKDEKIIITS